MGAHRCDSRDTEGTRLKNIWGVERLESDRNPAVVLRFRVLDEARRCSTTRLVPEGSGLGALRDVTSAA